MAVKPSVNECAIVKIEHCSIAVLIRELYKNRAIINKI
jgi:hypothetical protein